MVNKVANANPKTGQPSRVKQFGEIHDNYNWIECVSKKNPKVNYFYNMRTHCRTWRRPVPENVDLPFYNPYAVRPEKNEDENDNDWRIETFVSDLDEAEFDDDDDENHQLNKENEKQENVLQIGAKLYYSGSRNLRESRKRRISNENSESSELIPAAEFLEIDLVSESSSKRMRFSSPTTNLSDQLNLEHLTLNEFNFNHNPLTLNLNPVTLNQLNQAPVTSNQLNFNSTTLENLDQTSLNKLTLNELNLNESSQNLVDDLLHDRSTSSCNCSICLAHDEEAHDASGSCDDTSSRNSLASRFSAPRLKQITLADLVTETPKNSKPRRRRKPKKEPEKKVQLTPDKRVYDMYGNRTICYDPIYNFVNPIDPQGLENSRLSDSSEASPVAKRKTCDNFLRRLRNPILSESDSNETESCASSECENFENTGNRPDFSQICDKELSISVERVLIIQDQKPKSQREILANRKLFVRLEKLDLTKFRLKRNGSYSSKPVGGNSKQVSNSNLLKSVLQKSASNLSERKSSQRSQRSCRARASYLELSEADYSDSSDSSSFPRRSSRFKSNSRFPLRSDSGSSLRSASKSVLKSSPKPELKSSLKIDFKSNSNLDLSSLKSDVKSDSKSEVKSGSKSNSSSKSNLKSGRKFDMLSYFQSTLSGTKSNLSPGSKSAVKDDLTNTKSDANASEVWVIEKSQPMKIRLRKVRTDSSASSMSRDSYCPAKKIPNSEKIENFEKCQNFVNELPNFESKIKVPETNCNFAPKNLQIPETENSGTNKIPDSETDKMENSEKQVSPSVKNLESLISPILDDVQRENSTAAEKHNFPPFSEIESEDPFRNNLDFIFNSNAKLRMKINSPEKSPFVSNIQLPENREESARNRELENIEAHKASNKIIELMNVPETFPVFHQENYRPGTPNYLPEQHFQDLYENFDHLPDEDSEYLEKNAECLSAGNLPFLQQISGNLSQENYQYFLEVVSNSEYLQHENLEDLPEKNADSVPEVPTKAPLGLCPIEDSQISMYENQNFSVNFKSDSRNSRENDNSINFLSDENFPTNENIYNFTICDNSKIQGKKAGNAEHEILFDNTRDELMEFLQIKSPDVSRFNVESNNWENLPEPDPENAKCVYPEKSKILENAKNSNICHEEISEILKISLPEELKIMENPEIENQLSHTKSKIEAENWEKNKGKFVVEKERSSSSCSFLDNDQSSDNSSSDDEEEESSTTREISQKSVSQKNSGENLPHDSVSKTIIPRETSANSEISLKIPSEKISGSSDTAVIENSSQNLSSKNVSNENLSTKFTGETNCPVKHSRTKSDEFSPSNEKSGSKISNSQNNRKSDSNLNLVEHLENENKSNLNFVEEYLEKMGVTLCRVVEKGNSRKNSPECGDDNHSNSTENIEYSDKDVLSLVGSSIDFDEEDSRLDSQLKTRKSLISNEDYSSAIETYLDSPNSNICEDIVDQ